MEWIEQAIFTSAETDRSAGYQVVATSPGVSEADARELAAWGPSHDALLELTSNAMSYNFHPLPSGSYCVSRTTPAGWEYSGRGGARIYTQCLVVLPETLERFANNPFALMRAALAAGALRLFDKVPKQLEPFRLAGRAAVIDAALLARLCASPGIDWMAALVQAALVSNTVAVVAGTQAEHVIAGLINCLPPECRPQYSFSTGLKCSSRRPFRVVAMPADREEQLRVRRLYDAAVLDLSAPLPAEFAPVESWARFIQRVLKSGRTSMLAKQLSARRREFAPDDLPALGLQMLEELDASSLDDSLPNGQHLTGRERPENNSRTVPIFPEGESGCPPPKPGEPTCRPFLDRDDDTPDVFPPDLTWEQEQPDPEAQSPSGLLKQAHEAHPQCPQAFCPSAAQPCTDSVPLQVLNPDDRAVLDKLEQLDDLVYEAIDGEVGAMDQLKTFWPQVRDELGDELLCESQEQYLRYALSTWVESVEPDEQCADIELIRDPTRAVHSLDVLCLLFDNG